MARYWVGGAADTAWSNANNWSTTSGGAGGAGIPTQNDEVYFDIKGSGHCYLSEDVSFSGFFVPDAITYDVYASNYTLNSYGNVNAYPVTQFVNGWTGDLVQHQSVSAGAMALGPTSNACGRWVLPSGITVNLTNYFHCKLFKAEADTSVTGATNYTVITYPTQNHFFEVHPTFTAPNGMRWYIGSTDVANSGCLPGKVSNITMGYGGNTGASYTMLSDMYLTSVFHFHASNGAIAENQVRHVKTNGYNIICQTILMGIATDAYNGYGSKISFDTGTHDFQYMYLSGYGKNTYAYIDWGSGICRNNNGYFHLDGVHASYTHDCQAKIDMIGTTKNYIQTSGNALPQLRLWREIYLRKYDADVCDLFIYPPNGKVDLNGYNLNMPQRVRPLTVGGLKTFIGKKWVN